MRHIELVETIRETVTADEVACMITIARDGKDHATVAAELDEAFSPLMADAHGLEHVLGATRSGSGTTVYLERTLDVRGPIEQVATVVARASAVPHCSVGYARYSVSPAVQAAAVERLESEALVLARRRAERIAGALSGEVGEVWSVSFGDVHVTSPPMLEERVVDLSPSMIVVGLALRVEYELLGRSTPVANG